MSSRGRGRQSRKDRSSGSEMSDLLGKQDDELLELLVELGVDLLGTLNKEGLLALVEAVAVQRQYQAQRCVCVCVCVTS